MFKKIASKYIRGFTIIELIVSIAIIGILASIVAFTYSSWQVRVVTVELKNDLGAASMAMENYRNFNNGYPASIPSTFSPSPDVIITGGSTDVGETFCISATSTRDPNIKYYFDSTISGQGAQTGMCAATPILTLPSSPVVTVALNGANVQATITSLTCVSGTIQYGIRNRTNDGTWGSYSAWSGTLVYSQVAADGVKYGYQAQARCYVDISNISFTATGVESTYTDPIATPAAPTVAASTVGATTTYTWNNTCAAGTTARYEYTYYTSAGYNSGWVANTTASFAATTSAEGYTYSLIAHTQCYTAIATSAGWSVTSNVAAYYRPLTVPSLTATTASSTSINLSWAAIAGVTSYTLQRDTVSSFASAVQIASQVGTTFTSSGLAQGSVYYYRVNNVQPGGTSGWSTTASAITTINVPAAPTVAASTVGATTTYTWNNTCAAGTTARYEYTYYTSAGYNSGWVANTTASFAATTSAEGYTYSLIAHTQCYTAIATSAGWSVTSNVGSYYRPFVLYYYNKYLVASSSYTYYYETGGWVYLGRTSYISSGSQGNPNYSFSSSSGYSSSGLAPYFGNTLYGAYPDGHAVEKYVYVSGGVSGSNITVDIYNRSCTQATGYNYYQGSLVTANIIAADGTYPINGQHTDGYWYVRGARAN